MVTSWTLRGRDSSLAGLEVVSDWGGTLVQNHLTPDSLQVSGRTDRLRALLTPGGGCTLESDGGVAFSGPMTAFSPKGDGTCTVTFASDLIWLWARICYPNPALAWEAQDRDYDARTGPLETLLLAYINANAGPGALTARRVGPLSIPASLGRGETRALSVRFDTLGQLVRDLAEAAGLGVAVVQVGATLEVRVTQPPDVSGWARYGTSTSGGAGLLAPDWTAEVLAPTVTAALVAGGGEGKYRILREFRGTDAEELWGSRFELLVDQRDTVDTAALTKSGQDAVAEGSKPVDVRAPLPDLPDMRLGVDIPLGSLVGLDLDGIQVTDRLRQITTTFGPAGIRRAGVVGSPDAGLTADQKKFLKLHKALRKVQAS